RVLRCGRRSDKLPGITIISNVIPGSSFCVEAWSKGVGLLVGLFRLDFSTKERVKTMIWRTLCMASLLVCLSTAKLVAHGVDHVVTRTGAVVVTLSHDDGDMFSNETYEVFGPGDSTPFQSGRTDKLGRIVFVPDRTGEWRVRAFSEDGHGADFTVNVDNAGDLAGTAPARGPASTVGRILAGVIAIFALFGIALLFMNRRRSSA
ncbi:MAG: hypothetical protein P8181_03190, partial [bacterium]